VTGELKRDKCSKTSDHLKRV